VTLVPYNDTGGKGTKELPLLGLLTSVLRPDVGVSQEAVSSSNQGQMRQTSRRRQDSIGGIFVKGSGKRVSLSGNFMRNPVIPLKASRVSLTHSRKPPDSRMVPLAVKRAISSVDTGDTYSAFSGSISSSLVRSPSSSGVTRSKRECPKEDSRQRLPVLLSASFDDVTPDLHSAPHSPS